MLRSNFSSHRQRELIIGATQPPDALIPDALIPWLTATGSLTAKFEALSGEKLRVKPQWQGRQTLSLWEKCQLGLDRHRPQSAWVREALLYGQGDETEGQAWVAARSVFPFVSLTGEARQLANLGETPIGYVMFGRGGATVRHRTLLQTPQGWQRSTVYDWQGRKVLISETFLPAFLQFLQTLA